MKYSKIRKKVGRETLVHREKNKYNRNVAKRRLRRILDKHLVNLKERDTE